MADYRFSAKIIKRSNGQSSVASAAYRSGSRLIDDRTGEIHDYTRKQGVTHSEVMSPDNTPEWMQDRTELWNAIEAVERRKDAQLSREIQLSLPHELEPEQRTELVRGFVQEQFVDRGMIADVNIHLPDKGGDQRNHHAHVMLTMREMTGDGFGNKSREWNDPELLNQWREGWANHQNNALERHGHNERVSHLSYESQGIDREPTQHLGTHASDMERNGKPSRIGDENRAIANDNKERAQEYAQLVSINTGFDDSRPNYDKWIDEKLREIDSVQDLKKLDLAQKQSRQTARLETHLQESYGAAKATIAAEIKSIDKRLGAKGFRKVVRTVFGMNKSDQKHRDAMQKTLTGIEKRENEQRGLLARTQKLEKRKQAERQQRRKDRVSGALNRRKEQSIAKRLKKRVADKPKLEKKTRPTTTRAEKLPEHIKADFIKKAEQDVKSTNAPSLDDEKLSMGKHSLDKKRGDLTKPWRRSLSEDREAKPFRRSPTRERTRSPNPDKGGKT